MRRRRLFTLLSALSLLLCVGACVVWSRSYSRADSISHTDVDTSRLYWLYASYGRVWLGVQDRGLLSRAPTKAVFGLKWSQEPSGHPVECTYNWLGFGWTPARGVAIPHWFLAVGFVLLPSYRVAQRAWSHKRFVGHCLSCGYDLRATPDRCPECGTETKIPAGVADVDKRTV